MARATRTTAALLTIVAFLATSTAVPAQESQPATTPTGTIVMSAVWDAGNLPAAGVTVGLTSFGRLNWGRATTAGRTDAAGVLRIAHVPTGLARISAFWGGTAEGQVRADAETRLRVMVPRGQVVEGVVLDAAGRPVSGADVDCGATRLGWEAQRVATTAADGTFRVPSAGTGTQFQVSARAPGHTPSPAVPLVGKAGEVQHVRLVVGDGGADVSGRVVDAAGMPVAGASVWLARSGSTETRLADGTSAQFPRTVFTLTDVDGEFRALGLHTGRTTLSVQATHHPDFERMLQLAAGPAPQERIVLGAGSTLVVRVLDEDQAPVAGAIARVAVQMMSGSRDLSGTTDVDGTFIIDGLAAGDARIAIDHASGRAQTTVRVVAGETITCTAQLSAGARIRGRIVDERGAPLRSDHVNCLASGGGGRDVPTDGGGRFVVPFCSESRYTLLVHDPATRDRAVPWCGNNMGGPGIMARVDNVTPDGPELVIRVPDAMRATAFIVARFVGADGQSCAVEVGVAHAAGGYNETLRAQSPTFTDSRERADAAAGVFRFGPLPPGTYTMLAHGVGAPAFRRSGIVVDAAATCDLGVLAFPAGGVLVATFARAGAAPVGAVYGEIVQADGVAATGFTVTGGEGRSLPLVPGRHLLRIQGPDTVTQEVPFDIRVGEPTKLSVILVTPHSK